jgi:hypothetical protein
VSGTLDFERGVKYIVYWGFNFSFLKIVLAVKLHALVQGICIASHLLKLHSKESPVQFCKMFGFLATASAQKNTFSWTNAAHKIWSHWNSRAIFCIMYHDTISRVEYAVYECIQSRVTQLSMSFNGGLMPIFSNKWYLYIVSSSSHCYWELWCL